MVAPRKSSTHVQTARVAHPMPAGGLSDELEELILTLRKGTYELVDVARLDAKGQRHPFSEQEWLELGDHERVDEILRGAQEAFEAGLAEGLGAEDDEDDFDGDALLSRLLLSRSAQRGVLRLGMRQRFVRRLLLRRLLRSRLTRGPAAMEQRRKPISDAVRNGSSSNR